jgi:Hpt domain
MATDKPAALQIETFADHHVITQPNPLRKVLRRVAEKDLDDPVARAEKALADLSSEFKNWMEIETDRLAAAHAAIFRDGFTNFTREELFRAAHDIKGDAATFGFPSAGASHQRHSGHRARAYHARHRGDGRRIEPATARHSGRVSRSRQSRPARSPRSDPRTWYCAGRVTFGRPCERGDNARNDVSS